MKLAIIVPGGVDRSGEVRVIPAFIGLISRLAAEHDVHVFATHQEDAPGSWVLEGARVHNLGLPRTAWRAVNAIRSEHRKQPFQLIHALWAGRHGALAVGAATWLGLPSIVHVAGGELVALADIDYGGCRTWRGRVLVGGVLRRATLVTCASTPMVELIAASGVKRTAGATRRGPATVAAAPPPAQERRRASAPRPHRKPKSCQGSTDVAARAT